MRHKHLAARKRPFLHSQIGERVDAGHKPSVEPHFLRNAVPEARSVYRHAVAALGNAFNRNRDTPRNRYAAENSLCSIFLSQRLFLIGKHRRVAKRNRAAVLRQGVWCHEEHRDYLLRSAVEDYAVEVHRRGQIVLENGHYHFRRPLHRFRHLRRIVGVHRVTLHVGIQAASLRKAVAGRRAEAHYAHLLVQPLQRQYVGIVFKHRDGGGKQPAVHHLGRSGVDSSAKPFYIHRLIRVKPSRIFITQYLLARLVNSFLHLAAFLVCGNHGFVALAYLVRLKKHVGTGHHRRHSVSLAVHVRPAHLQRVSENQPLESHIVLKQLGSHLLAKRGGTVAGLQRGYVEMTHHHARQPGAYIAPERDKLGRLQLDERTVHHRQRLVRVLVGVAMPREMLCRRKHAVVLQAFGVCHGLPGHIVRVFAERARPDYRVRRIAVHVHRRREIQVHPGHPAFRRHLLAVVVQQTVVLYRSESHVFRETRGVVHTHRQSPLAVKPYHYRQLRDSIGVIGQFRVVFQRPFRKIYEPYIVVFDQSLHR